ncbi:hypothetical protein GCM10009863_57160 [Streptomyces axinellae]|uniref:Uncharacterized protein n=1 Tax=Streptomyces axinellae TaxID=552788 RepID=A0ABN3QSJ4_9ACTN
MRAPQLGGRLQLPRRLHIPHLTQERLPLHTEQPLEHIRLHPTILPRLTPAPGRGQPQPLRGPLPPEGPVVEAGGPSEPARGQPPPGRRPGELGGECDRRREIQARPAIEDERER